MALTLMPTSTLGPARSLFADGMRFSLLFAVIGVIRLAAAPDPVWQNFSSRRGELPPPPGGSTQQTGAIVADFDGDGLNDFILSFRQKPPALVWYRRSASGW